MQVLRVLNPGGAAPSAPGVADEEESAEADREDQAPVECVLYRDKRERPVTRVIPCEEQAAHEGHYDSNGVNKNNMHTAECESRCEYIAAPVAEQLRIAAVDESAVDHFLRPYGEERIEDHYEDPQTRTLSGE